MGIKINYLNAAGGVERTKTLGRVETPPAVAASKYERAKKWITLLSSESYDPMLSLALSAAKKLVK